MNEWSPNSKFFKYRSLLLEQFLTIPREDREACEIQLRKLKKGQLLEKLFWSDEHKTILRLVQWLHKLKPENKSRMLKKINGIVELVPIEFFHTGERNVLAPCISLCTKGRDWMVEPLIKFYIPDVKEVKNLNGFGDILKGLDAMNEECPPEKLNWLFEQISRDQLPDNIKAGMEVIAVLLKLENEEETTWMLSAISYFPHDIMEVYRTGRRRNFDKDIFKIVEMLDPFKPSVRFDILWLLLYLKKQYWVEEVCLLVKILEQAKEKKIDKPDEFVSHEVLPLVMNTVYNYEITDYDTVAKHLLELATNKAAQNAL